MSRQAPATGVQAVRSEAYDPVSGCPPPTCSPSRSPPPSSSPLDTETNGLARERCELTEVGAVLVGGGELHDRWSSLVGVGEPLGRGIQRFTGITQAMVDEAPPPEAVLPELAELLRGRVLVAHNARVRRRACSSRRSRARRSTGRTRRCCARSRSRAGSRRCSAAAGWPRSPTRSGSRSARRTARCPTRRPARACCARCCRGCARTRARSARRSRVLRPARGAGRRRRAPGAKRPRDERPDLSTLPKDPGVYIFRDADGHPLYVGKSVCLRTRARAHFTTPVGLDRAGRARRLPADRVRARRAACSRTG